MKEYKKKRERERERDLGKHLDYTLSSRLTR